jgi:hypothetical protein
MSKYVEWAAVNTLGGFLKSRAVRFVSLHSENRGDQMSSEKWPKMTTKWPQNDHKMTKKWPKNDQKMTKKWPKNDQKMTTKWPQNDQKMTKKWPKNDQKMTRQGAKPILIIFGRPNLSGLYDSMKGMSSRTDVAFCFYARS